MAYDIPAFLRMTDPRILQQGRAYYAEGHIQRLNLWEGQYTAAVLGRRAIPYTLEISLASDGTIRSWQCSCPYHAGPVCKHVVAVMLAIQDGIVAGEALPPDPVMPVLQVLVDDSSREELAELLLAHCQTDLHFRTQVLAALRPFPGWEVTAIKALVDDAVRRAGHRGFVQQQACVSVSHDLRLALERARRYIEEAQFGIGLEITQYILLAGVQLFRIADDRAGTLSEAIGNALDIIQSAVVREDFPQEARRPQLDKLLETASHPDLGGLDNWRCALLRSASYLADRDSVAAIYGLIDRILDHLHDTPYDTQLRTKLQNTRQVIARRIESTAPSQEPGAEAPETVS